ncbi:MAG: photosynthetic complex assembly protein PuhC [Gemmatimonadales bacterium]|nr:photosynthetic complex assembly protein PuhC [Gemmatimonadales bacterium]
MAEPSPPGQRPDPFAEGLAELEADSENIVVPRPALIGAGLLIAFSITLAAVARMTGSGRTPNAPGVVAASRQLDFRAVEPDSVRVVDHETGETIVTFMRDQGGFVTGSLRAFAWERHVRGSKLEAAPFTLMRYQDGRAMLLDSVTGMQIPLEAFGPDNREAFVRLLQRSP